MLTTSDFVKKEYGKKLYKISFDGGFSCPNRDGKLGTGGCIFCSQGGSGDFAVSPFDEASINIAKEKVSKKYKGSEYIAYFQAFTGTYGDASRLEEIYMPVVLRDDIAVLSIATRPDCLSEEIYDLLARLNSIKPVWVELGLQTTKPESVDFIRRGYDNSVYETAVKRLNSIGIHTITHVILYLPGETIEDMLSTIQFAIDAGTKGIKLSLLHILKNTDLADIYIECPFYVPTLEEYVDTLKKCVEIIPSEIVVHRLTGDPPKSLLIEPKWAANKKVVLNTINDALNPSGPYYVYMLECGDGSYYTGSTNDVAKRFGNHSLGKGCKYTASHLPVKLIYVETLKSKRAALKREYAIKQLTRTAKEKLVKDKINEISSFVL